MKKIKVFLLVSLLLVICFPMHTVSAANKVNMQSVLRTYKEFAKYYDASASGQMPLAYTNYAAQGMCVAGDYLLIAYYDTEEENNSLIQIMSKDSKQWLGTVYLPDKTHAGGLAFDNNSKDPYIWICDDSSSEKYSISAISFTRIKESVEQKVCIDIDYLKTINLDIRSSFCTFFDGYLWIGEFDDKADGKVRGYEIEMMRAGALPTNYKSFQAPSKTQGMCFTKVDNEVYLLLSRSYGRYATSTSELRIYKPSYTNPTKDGFIYKNDAIKHFTLPLMAEGIACTSDYVYVVYESTSNKYNAECPYPVDKCTALRLVSTRWHSGVIKNYGIK